MLDYFPKITRQSPTIFFNVVIKRVEASATNYKCWGDSATQVASIDVEAPAGYDKLMIY
jgi:hypothetical protein